MEHHGHWRVTRRRIAAALLLTVTTSLAANAAPSHTSADAQAHTGRIGAAVAPADPVDSPMYRGSAAGNPIATTSQNLSVNWTSPPLQSLTIDATPYSNTLYISGMVFGPFAATGSQFHDPFYALDVRTGKVLWQTYTPN
ncbi:MAG: hypothetical protein LC769_00810, partial [Chloroflexi bacterium]|nr:hypothetical protein [Chloroflexota bacterium]